MSNFVDQTRPQKTACLLTYHFPCRNLLLAMPIKGFFQFMPSYITCKPMAPNLSHMLLPAYACGAPLPLYILYNIISIQPHPHSNLTHPSPLLPFSGLIQKHHFKGVQVCAYTSLYAFIHSIFLELIQFDS